jgi:hypothetical protein
MLYNTNYSILPPLAPLNVSEQILAMRHCLCPQLHALSHTLTLPTCHDPPSKFFIPSSSYTGPSTAPAAPAPAAPAAPAYHTPVAPAHHAPVHLHIPEAPASHTPFYDQTTYYTVEPLNHVMEDAEPGAASP